MEKELRLECLKVAASVASREEVMKVAKEFWEFMSSAQSRPEHPHTEQSFSDTPFV